MEPETDTAHLRRNQIIDLLVDELTDPVHKRLVRAGKCLDAVAGMEAELSTILLEVLHSEDPLDDGEGIPGVQR